MNTISTSKYSAPKCELIDVNVEHGFIDSFGAEGVAGQNINIYEYDDMF